MSEQDPVGTELAGYRIEELLGRGGMGVVYRAHDLALERDVALKLLAPELAGDVRFRERFLRESRLAASLDHPAIVPIYDAGEVAGRLYIAMRLVDGADLKRLLAADGPFEPGRALAYLEQVADALDAAHERGLVHRDVKASNVLVDRRDHCYLADFGLSRRLGDATAAAGASRSLGTLSYVAPEQIRGDDVDGRADLYALGCLLYECVAGQPPFAGRSDTAIVFAHLEEPPPALPPFDAVLARALAKDPAERYQSGRELIAAARAAVAGRRRPRARLFATIGVLAVVAAALAVATTRHGAATVAAPSLPIAPNALSVVDPHVAHVRATVAGTGDASDIAFTRGSAWISSPGRHRLVAVDLATHRVVRTVALPWAQTERIAAGGGAVWVREARNLGRRVFGIDERTGRVVQQLTFGGSSAGIAFGHGSLWLVGGANVTRFDPRTKRVLHVISVAADVLAYGDGALWAASSNGDIWKIDAVENRIAAHTRLHPTITDVAVADGFVWASVVGDSAVFKLSENDLSVQGVYPLRSDPARVAFARGTLWTANTDSATISSIAVGTGRRRTIATGADPTTVAYHRGAVWVASAAALPPLPPVALSLRVSTPFPLLNVDPEQRVFPMDEQLSYTTCSNLLGYPDSAGPRGQTLTPELAASMPTVSADGRTYTLRVRSGVRFSPPSGELVTARTFAHTIERTMGPKAQRPWDYLGDIVGAQAYERGAARHIAGISARGSTLTFRLVRPAGDFLARLTLPVFCPVPLATPLVPRRTHMPIPSTGPYYIAAVEPHRIVLLRNPGYTGPRPRRAARIVFTDGTPTTTAVRLVARGKLDYLPPDLSPGPLAPGSAEDNAYGAHGAGRQRFFLHDRPLLDTIVFNTRRPLFAQARLRQAVGFALDRASVARAYSDAPAARIVPSVVPGFDVPGVYPLEHPNLSTARRLEGGVHRHAVLLAPCDSSVVPAALLVRSDLAKIGIAVHVAVTDACDTPTVTAKIADSDMVIGANIGRGPPDRDPAAFLAQALEGGGYQGTRLGPGPWYGPSFRGRLARAGALRGSARIRAYRRLDDELARDAPFVVYGAFQYDEFFAARIGCERFQSFYAVVDLGALCVRP